MSLQNVAAINAANVQSDRLDEILSHEVQEGATTLTNKGYDIEFKNVGFSYDTKDTVLKDVSFVAKQGEVTALMAHLVVERLQYRVLLHAFGMRTRERLQLAVWIFQKSIRKHSCHCTRLYFRMLPCLIIQ